MFLDPSRPSPCKALEIHLLRSRSRCHCRNRVWHTWPGRRSPAAAQEKITADSDAPHSPRSARPAWQCPVGRRSAPGLAPGRLADSPDQGPGALCRGRLGRQRRARLHRPPGKRTRPAVCSGKPARRLGHAGRIGADPGARRRLHTDGRAHGGDGHHACRAPDALRSAEGHHCPGAPGRFAGHADDHKRTGREDPAGLHQAGARQPGQICIRLVRHRHHHPPERRDPAAVDRHPATACALQVDRRGRR